MRSAKQRIRASLEIPHLIFYVKNRLRDIVIPAQSTRLRGAFCSCGHALTSVRHVVRKGIFYGVSSMRPSFLSAEAFATKTSSYFEEIAARAYGRYQALLTENSALDFDDIIMKTVELLREDDEVRGMYLDNLERICAPLL